MSVVLITGENAYLRRQELGRRIADFKADHGDLSVQRMEAEDLTANQLAEATSGGSLFAPTVLTIVDGASGNKALHELIIERAKAKDPDSTLILHEPSIDKRQTFYKDLKKSAEVIEYKNLEPYQLSKWLVDEAKERGGELSQGDASYLIDRCGNDQWRLSNELDKLVAYEPKISRQAIDELVQLAPKDNIFQLLDQATQGNSKQAIATYRALRNARLETGYIMSMLAWQINNIAVVGSSKMSDPDQIARSAGISPYVAKKLTGVTRNLSKQRLRELVELTLNADLELKNGAEPDDCLEQYLLRVGVLTTS